MKHCPTYRGRRGGCLWFRYNCGAKRRNFCLFLLFGQMPSSAKKSTDHGHKFCWWNLPTCCKNKTLQVILCWRTLAVLLIIMERFYWFFLNFKPKKKRWRETAELGWRKERYKKSVLEGKVYGSDMVLIHMCIIPQSDMVTITYWNQQSVFTERIKKGHT